MWRVLTGADFTRKGSRGFPQPTRVLLYLAISLVTATLLAFIITRPRERDGAGHLIGLGRRGGRLAGRVLFVMGLVAGLWLGLATEADIELVKSNRVLGQASERQRR